jgi:hypothetical protein
MSVDFRKTPLENLMEMLNAKSSVVAAVPDFQTISDPVVLVDDPDGYNTQVSLRTTMAYTHAGKVSPKFNRRPLTDVITADVNVTVEDTATFAEALDMYRRKYGIYLDEHDIEPVGAFNVSGGELSYQIPVRSPLKSYGYFGTATLTVNVNWRLDDPELVEVEVNRLRQLVQFDLPLAITAIF